MASPRRSVILDTAMYACLHMPVHMATRKLVCAHNDAHDCTQRARARARVRASGLTGSLAGRQSTCTGICTHRHTHWCVWLYTRLCTPVRIAMQCLHCTYTFSSSHESKLQLHSASDVHVGLSRFFWGTASGRGVTAAAAARIYYIDAHIRTRLTPICKRPSF